MRGKSLLLGEECSKLVSVLADHDIVNLFKYFNCQITGVCMVSTFNWRYIICINTYTCVSARRPD